MKYNADGTSERHKARLVVLGNKKIEEEDFDETFAPVVKMSTVRGLLSLVSSKGWEIHQMDIHNAFLHGNLEEEVYIKLPPGFTHSDSTKVCRLRKSLYGIRQAPRCWFAKLSKAFLEFSFMQSYSDYSLLTFTRNETKISVLIYVDDLVIASNNLEKLNKFKVYLGDFFSYERFGQTKIFLGY